MIIRRFGNECWETGRRQGASWSSPQQMWGDNNHNSSSSSSSDNKANKTNDNDKDHYNYDDSNNNNGHFCRAHVVGSPVCWGSSDISRIIKQGFSESWKCALCSCEDLRLGITTPGFSHPGQAFFRSRESPCFKKTSVKRTPERRARHRYHYNHYYSSID